MDKPLFFTENFFKDLDESQENVLYSSNKIIVRGTSTISLVKAFLFKSEKRSFALKEEDAKRRNYDINQDNIRINGKNYEIKKGFIGQKDLSLINVLIKEHKILLETVALMQTELSYDYCDCNKLNDLLNLLFSQLVEHLEKEDRYLYKNYLKRKSFVDIINLYKDSMTLISKTAISYYEKWKDAVNADNLDEFKGETNGIFAVLGERIMNEEENFFPELLK